MTLPHKNGRMHTDDTNSGRFRDHYETGENSSRKSSNLQIS